MGNSCTPYCLVHLGTAQNHSRGISPECLGLHICLDRTCRTTRYLSDSLFRREDKSCKRWHRLRRGGIYQVRTACTPPAPEGLGTSLERMSRTRPIPCPVQSYRWDSGDSVSGLSRLRTCLARTACTCPAQEGLGMSRERTEGTTPALPPPGKTQQCILRMSPFILFAARSTKPALCTFRTVRAVFPYRTTHARGRSAARAV